MIHAYHLFLIALYLVIGVCDSNIKRTCGNHMKAVFFIPSELPLALHALKPRSFPTARAARSDPTAEQNERRGRLPCAVRDARTLQCA